MKHLTCKTLLTALTVTLTSVVVYANGSSYSGPFLGGDAIPTQSENRIDTSKIRAATVACLEQLNIEVWNKLHRSNFQLAVVANRPSQMDDNGRVEVFKDPDAFRVNFNSNNCVLTSRLRGFPKYAQMSFSICNPTTVVIEANSSFFNIEQFVLPRGLSFFSHENGRFVVVHGNQKIQTADGRDTGLTIDNNRHTQCLRTNTRP